MATLMNTHGITFNDGTVQTTASFSAANNCIYENNQTITANYTMSSGKNGQSAGPITIANGVTVTIPTGSVWVIS